MNKGTIRVLNALSLFSQRPSWGVTEVSRELACAKNSAFQALDTLAKEGYVVRDPSGQRYQLGHRAIDFVGDDEALDVRSLCHPYLVRLQELTRVSVFLSIIVGRYNLCIESIQAQGVTVGYVPLSQPIPLHAGAGSRLLLALLQDEEIRRYIEVASPLRAATPTTIVDPDALWENLRLIRSVGFAQGLRGFLDGGELSYRFPSLGR